MYAVIRRYTFDPKAANELNGKVRDSFLPLIKKIPGFVAYYWFNVNDNMGASLSVFADRKGAEESVCLAGRYVKDELSTVLGAPEILEGVVLAHS
jgi:hypothetical protein